MKLALCWWRPDGAFVEFDGWLCVDDETTTELADVMDRSFAYLRSQPMLAGRPYGIRFPRRAPDVR